MLYRGDMCRGDEGVALLLALLFIVLITAIVVEYAYETQVEASLVSNDDAHFEAHVAAKSAVARALSALAGDLIEVEEYVGGNFDSELDLWAMPAPMEPINNALMRYTVVDEFGKLNLNALIRYDEEGNRVVNELLVETLHYLFDLRAQYYNLELNPTDAILDWLDADLDPEEEGAEADYYSALEIPYPCRNGRMDSIEELLLIRGVTPELYFGLANEAQEEEDVPPEEQLMPLTDLLTVHGDPGGLINVNTAQPELLEALFEVWPSANPGLVDLIMTRRADSMPFISEEDALSVFGTAGKDEIQPADVVTVASKVFRIYGDGLTEDTQVRIEAYVWRKPILAMGRRHLEARESFRILDWRVIR
ncbi:MAG TPA: general secretion pathway protein GspK [Candidatus Hydrogenedentes bacterium]|nr:general secretion pathway protein GspK [Candidatus Hydrogenedentota bacterium]